MAAYFPTPIAPYPYEVKQRVIATPAGYAFGSFGFQTYSESAPGAYPGLVFTKASGLVFSCLVIDPDTGAQTHTASIDLGARFGAILPFSLASISHCYFAMDSLKRLMLVIIGLNNVTPIQDNVVIEVLVHADNQFSILNYYDLGVALFATINGVLYQMGLCQENDQTGSQFTALKYNQADKNFYWFGTYKRLSDPNQFTQIRALRFGRYNSYYSNHTDYTYNSTFGVAASAFFPAFGYNVLALSGDQVPIATGPVTIIPIDNTITVPIPLTAETTFDILHLGLMNISNAAGYIAGMDYSASKNAVSFVAGDDVENWFTAFITLSQNPPSIMLYSFPYGYNWDGVSTFPAGTVYTANNRFFYQKSSSIYEFIPNINYKNMLPCSNYGRPKGIKQ
jgi:hypothetical protein